MVATHLVRLWEVGAVVAWPCLLSGSRDRLHSLNHCFHEGYRSTDIDAQGKTIRLIENLQNWAARGRCVAQL